jgi:uncharacterized protein VirK/YbjX
MNNYFQTVRLLLRAGVANFPVTQLKNLPKRLLFYGHAFTNFSAIHQWVHNNPPRGMQLELQRSSALLKAVSNPYVHTLWPMPERMRAISAHYRLLEELKLEFLNFSADYYWVCTTFELGDKSFRIMLDRPPWMAAEGQMVVSLFMGVHRVYAIAFSLAGEAAAPQMLIGAIQGMHSTPDSTTLYADLTKLFQGARPRDLMLNIAKMVAHSMGCTAVLAIADDCHQSLGRGNEFARAAKYDEVWTENGGTRTEAGFFAMTTQVPRRADADIPARKRAVYRRRYELLDSLEQSIGAAFAADHKEIKLHGQ